MENIKKKISLFWNHKHNRIQLLLLAALFILYFLPRFYNIQHRIGFDWDQEKIATEVRNVVRDHKLSLLGPRANNDLGFFLAPYFNYMMIPFFLLTGLHPWAFVIFLIIYNLVFFIIAFFVVRNMFSNQVALSFLFIWALNTVLFEADIGPWWPVVIPLGVIITWNLLWNIYYTNTRHDWALLGLTLGVFVNMHFQFVFIIAFSAVFLILHARKTKQFALKTTILLCSFVAVFTPLFLFDLRHQFLNTNLFLHFFTNSDANMPHDMFSWIPVLTNAFLPFLFIKLTWLTYLFYGIVGSTMIYLTMKKKKFARLFYISSLVLWGLTLLGFAIYGKRPSEYYYIFTYAFIIVALSDLLITLNKKYILYTLLIVYTLFSVPLIITKISTIGLSLYKKDRAIQKLKTLVEGKKCNISYNVPLGRDNGFKYLVEYYKIKQTGNWSDPLVEIRIPPQGKDIVVEGIGIKIPPELK